MHKENPQFHWKMLIVTPLQHRMVLHIKWFQHRQPHLVPRTPLWRRLLFRPAIGDQNMPPPPLEQTVAAVALGDELLRAQGIQAPITPIVLQMERQTIYIPSQNDPEFDAILVSGAVMVQTVEGSRRVRRTPRDHIMSSRMVRRLKPQEGNGAFPTPKSRLCVAGHQGPGAEPLTAYAPTPQTETVNSILASKNWQLTVGDAKNASCQSNRLIGWSGREEPYLWSRRKAYNLTRSIVYSSLHRYTASTMLLCCYGTECWPTIGCRRAGEHLIL